MTNLRDLDPEGESRKKTIIFVIIIIIFIAVIYFAVNRTPEEVPIDPINTEQPLPG